jgi:hypothetical protein
MGLPTMYLGESPKSFSFQSLAGALQLGEVGFELVVRDGPDVFRLQSFDRGSQFTHHDTVG